MNKTPQTLTFYSPKGSDSNGAIFIDTGISAGFPSPADDHVADKIDLNKYLICRI